MMKQQWTVALFGAALFGIPAVASQQGNAIASLQAALDSTQAALQELVGLEPHIAQGEPEAMQRLLELTEAPTGDDQVVDEQIIRLRKDIGRLQGALDQGPSSHGSQLPPDPSKGLRPGALVAMQSSQDTPGKVVQVKSFEQPGYSADEMQEAKLHVRAGQYEPAVELLRKQPETPETRYWLSRALQGIGETVEARELLRALSSEGESAHRYARWATQDLRMIELREKLKQQAKGGSKKQ